MIFHENRLQADDSLDISCVICFSIKFTVYIGGHRL